MKNFIGCLIFVFSFLTQSAIACPKLEFGASVCANYTRADAVFLGKAVKTEDVSDQADFGEGARKIRFQVLRNFKGADNPTFALTTSNCLPDIKKGQTWIVFAKVNLNRNFFYVFEGRRLDEKTDKAQTDYLQQIADGKTRGAIAGRLTAADNFGKYPFESAEIVIETNGVRQTLKTDADGAFSSGELAEGKYRVELKFPFRAGLVWTETLLKTSFTEGLSSIFRYEVELRDGDCDFAFFEVSKKADN